MFFLYVKKYHKNFSNLEQEVHFEQDTDIAIGILPEWKKFPRLRAILLSVEKREREKKDWKLFDHHINKIAFSGSIHSESLLPTIALFWNKRLMLDEMTQWND